MSDEWLPVSSQPKPDEPITFADWQKREKANEVVAARLALIARGVMPGPDPVYQLAELGIIDAANGRDPDFSDPDDWPQLNGR